MGRTVVKYQLILQWPAESLDDYDEMIRIEESLITSLRDVVEIDGHDMGAGETNIFIHSSQPTRAFERALSCLSPSQTATLRAAYREAESESFTILHPADLKRFMVR